jgi:hypothetical protein
MVVYTDRGRSVGIVRLRTKATEFSFSFSIQIGLQLQICRNSWNKCTRGKVVPMFNYLSRHEDVWRSGCTAPLIINVSTRWR